MRQGFSLVELSIVLVILGLLTGGILSGQSLIRAAEMRAIASEFQRYQAAAGTFRDKYFAVPGDFRDATKFWSLDAAGGVGCISTAGVATAAPGTCDGNGTGLLADAAAANRTGEKFQFWRQLALAGLIEGTYTGLSGPGNSDHAVAGVNTPPSRMSNGIWYATEHTSGNSWVFATPAATGNVLFIGATKTNDAPISPLFKPEELWNLDTKMDDGSPVSGKIMARYIAADLCTTAAARTDLTATYNLTRTSPSCVMHVVNPF